MKPTIPLSMLAPCGMNCQVCYAHLKKKTPCPGCHGEDRQKPGRCRTCRIKTCAEEYRAEFCSACPSFPCAILKRLDKSYRQCYQVSLIENAKRLQTVGAEQYLREEADTWTCHVCGGVISLHDRVCSECGQPV